LIETLAVSHVWADRLGIILASPVWASVSSPRIVETKPPLTSGSPLRWNWQGRSINIRCKRQTLPCAALPSRGRQTLEESPGGVDGRAAFAAPVLFLGRCALTSC